jgi:HAD superfamily hydrolase (TIGR01509 family)
VTGGEPDKSSEAPSQQPKRLPLRISARVPDFRDNSDQMAVRAVLFDLDLTLWRIATPASELPAAELRALVRSHQVDRVLATLRSACGDALAADAACAGAMTFLDGLWRDLMAGAGSDDLREIEAVTVLMEAMRGAGFDVSDAIANAVWAASYVPYPHFPLELFDDTRSTLAALRSRGARVAVVTNSPWPAAVRRPDLDAMGLGDFVDAVVSSGDVGYRKPHALVFERALAALDSQPAEAVMVGDSLTNDVLGAQKLGITGVWKRNGREPSPGADFTIDHLAELLELLVF